MSDIFPNLLGVEMERKLQEQIRMLKFDIVYDRYVDGKLDCEGAADLLNINVRTFLRWRDKYSETQSCDWSDGRVGRRASNRSADSEVARITKLYKDKYQGFNVKHFHSYLCWEEGFSLSYSWVKRTLATAGLVLPSKQGGDHRLRRPRRPKAGMMLHQDASTHNWFGEENCDLVVTMDDATSEITSAFFCSQEGTISSLRGIAETIQKKGLFCSFYTDRGSHYFTTPEANGKVDKVNLTQVGRALKQLSIKHMAAYSPEARGRSERMFGTIPLMFQKLSFLKHRGGIYFMQIKMYNNIFMQHFRRFCRIQNGIKWTNIPTNVSKLNTSFET